MTGKDIAILVLTVALVAMAVCTLVLLAKQRRRGGTAGEKTADIKVVDGVRYRTDTATDAGEEITHLVGDVVLAKGNACTALQNGAVLPGTYTVLSANPAIRVFNVRVGDFVREYKHGDTLVLADGETICAVSCTVLLR